jgi:hypothetical protein
VNLFYQAARSFSPRLFLPNFPNTIQETFHNRKQIPSFPGGVGFDQSGKFLMLLLAGE